jgi:hypothetical protein
MSKTPKKSGATAKPTLHLLKPPFTAEGLADLFRRLTGREPTPEGMETLRKTCAKLANKTPKVGEP